MADQEMDYYCALYDVAQAITSSLDLGEVLDRVVRSTADALHVKGVSLRLLSKDKRRLLAGAAYGLSEDYLRKGAVEVDKSGVDQEALKGKAVYIADAGRDSRLQYPGEVREEGIASVLVVPLKTRDQTIGIMRAYAAQRREFSAQETEFLELVANLSALAIDNARHYQELREDYEVMVSFKDRLFPL